MICCLLYWLNHFHQVTLMNHYDVLLVVIENHNKYVYEDHDTSVFLEVIRDIFTIVRYKACSDL